MQHPLHSFCFAELRTPDLASAKRHYGDLLGWSSVGVPGTSGNYCLFQMTYTSKFDTAHVYTLFKIGDRSVSGGGQLDPEWGVTPRWQVYFEVANHDATASRACELGGKSGFWRDVPHAGRIGNLTDARGGEFMVAQPLTASTSST